MIKISDVKVNDEEE